MTDNQTVTTNPGTVAKPVTVQAQPSAKDDALRMEQIIARVVGILGLIVTIGGAVQSYLQPGTHAALIVGGVITVASQAQHAVAHLGYQLGASG